jgi:hypothetical protein
MSSSALLPPLDTSSPPLLPLLPEESLLQCHLVEYADRSGLAWLTTQRVMLRAERPNALLISKIEAAVSPADKANLEKSEQFTLPLAHVSGQTESAFSEKQKQPGFELVLVISAQFHACLSVCVCLPVCQVSSCRVPKTAPRLC